MGAGGVRGGLLVTIDRLREEYGVRIIPLGNDPPRLRFERQDGPPPPEALPLLDEVKRHKAEVLEALTTAARWDEVSERARLAAIAARCGSSSDRWGVSWSDAWRRAAPRHREALDAALDGINEARRDCDMAAHIAACEALRRAVRAIVAAAPIMARIA